MIQDSETGEQTLSIKNMVCDRCIRVVREELENLGYEVTHIELGTAVIRTAKPFDKAKVHSVLRKNGFELLDDRRSRQIEQIRTTIIDLIYSDIHAGASHPKFPQILEQKIGLDYNYLSTLFSSHQGVTIEKFIILQKIERVKELLKYDELTLSEIAFKLGYSSISHLSNQFKKVTGLSPTAFKKLTNPTRTPLDKIGNSK